MSIKHTKKVEIEKKIVKIISSVNIVEVLEQLQRIGKNVELG